MSQSNRIDRLVAKKQRGDQLSIGETREVMGAGVAIAARGGAKIWSMREAWMPSQCTCKTIGRESCLRHKGQEALNQQMDGADPDGFAVFGQFPYGFFKDVLRMRLLGDDVARDEVLHVCSGTLGPREKWTVDMRPEARPRDRDHGWLESGAGRSRQCRADGRCAARLWRAVRLLASYECAGNGDKVCGECGVCEAAALLAEVERNARVPAKHLEHSDE